MATPVKNCINYWESAFFHHKFLMGPATRELVESTIKHLKALESYYDQLSPKAESTEIGDEKSLS